MTGKMEYIYLKIQQCILDEAYERELIDYLFNNNYPVNICDVTDAIMVELIKYAYNQTEKKHPLQYYLDKNDTLNYDKDRMIHSRLQAYIQKHRDTEYEKMSEIGMSAEDLYELKPKPMSNMTEKLNGYEISEMNFFESQNIHDLKLIRSIVDERIGDSKKISNNTFINIAYQYDNWVEELIKRSKKSDKDMLFCSLAYFTLEWKYAFETLYLIAEEMERKEVKELDFNTIIALCGFTSIQSRIGYKIATNMRMVKERQIIIPDLVTEGNVDLLSDIGIERENFVEKNALICDFKEGIVNRVTKKKFKDTFLDTTDKKDWASFFEEYDIFESHHKKEWTSRKIRNMRYLFKIISESKKQ